MNRNQIINYLYNNREINTCLKQNIPKDKFDDFKNELFLLLIEKGESELKRLWSDNQSYGDWDTSLLEEWDKELLLNSNFEPYELIDIFGTNELVPGIQKELEGSNFNDDLINVDDYIKQNIFFLNEYMIEFQEC